MVCGKAENVEKAAKATWQRRLHPNGAELGWRYRRPTICRIKGVTGCGVGAWESDSAAVDEGPGHIRSSWKRLVKDGDGLRVGTEREREKGRTRG